METRGHLARCVAGCRQSVKDGLRRGVQSPWRRLGARRILHEYPVCVMGQTWPLQAL